MSQAVVRGHLRWNSVSRRQRWLIAATLTVIVCAPFLTEVAQQAAYVAVCLGALAAIAARARSYPPRQGVWRWLVAAAAGCAGIANAIWGTHLSAAGGAMPGFTTTDVVYSLMYPLLAAGLFLLPGPSRVAAWYSGTAEAGIVLCTTGVLAWVLLYDPHVYDTAGWPGSPGVLAYPLLDMILIAVAVRSVVTHQHVSRAQAPLLAAIVLLTAADAVYFLDMAGGGTWSGPDFSVVCWLTAFALSGLAGATRATLESTTAPTPPRTQTVVALNLLMVFVGPAATAYSMMRHGDELDPLDVAIPLAASALIAVLLIARLLGAGRIVQRQADRLHHALDEQATLQASMTHLALHDSLTGLPNRHILHQRLEPGTRDQAGWTALLLLDLDGFKDINERFGHQVGDELLITVTERLRHTIGTTELLCRAGGDEFAIITTVTTAPDAQALAETVLAALRQPCTLGGRPLAISASIGIRLNDPAGTTKQPLGDADLALYTAKATGKDRAVLFGNHIRDEHERHLRMVEQLRHAVTNGEFNVHYQPIVTLHDSRIVAVEALLRWTPTGEAPIGPDRFIPVAETSGLIVELGEWVLRRACTDAAAWHHRHGIGLTVNVSPHQLADPDFAAKVRSALLTSGLPPAALTLEITEGVLLTTGTHAEQALSHLAVLRDDGIRVAVDDFGTGYSSMSYLRDLPIDILKIDRSFLPADGIDNRQLILVRAILDLAQGLQLTTVAEGVETPAHLHALRTMGCDRGQGYLFAKPLTATALDADLASLVPQYR